MDGWFVENHLLGSTHRTGNTGALARTFIPRRGEWSCATNLTWLGVSFVWQPGETGLTPPSGMPSVTYPSYTEFLWKPLKIPFAEQRQEQSVLVNPMLSLSPSNHPSKFLFPSQTSSGSSHILHSQEGSSYNGSLNQNGCGPKVVPNNNSAGCQERLSCTADLSSFSVFFFLSCHVSSSHQHDVKLALSLVFSVF